MSNYDNTVLEKALDLVIYRLLAPLENSEIPLEIYNSAFKGVKDSLIEEATERIQNSMGVGI